MLVCTLAIVGAAGCNTLRGVGKDIQKGGEAIEDAAKNVPGYSGEPQIREQLILTAAADSFINPLGMIGTDDPVD